MIHTFPDIAHLVDRMNRLEPAPLFVIDGNIARLYPALTKAAGKENLYLLTASEENKEIGTVMEICRFLMERRAGRHSTLISIGGGVTSDIAGFAAAIYKRGMGYISVPTTLLAQVDAGIGGKNGVNLDGYKNMIGTIRQPGEIFICPDFLRTLEKEEMESGWAEAIKTAIIQGDRLYGKCLEFLSVCGMYPETEQPVPAALLAEISEVKSRIVELDPDEQGPRRVLNFGHTYGHAIEKWHLDRGRHITHGRGVAMGMIFAAEISQRLGLAEEGIGRRLRDDFDRIGLTWRCDIPKKELDPYILQDKKAEGGEIHFAAIRRIGRIEPVKLRFSEIMSIEF